MIPYKYCMSIHIGLSTFLLLTNYKTFFTVKTIKFGILPLYKTNQYDVDDEKRIKTV